MSRVKKLEHQKTLSEVPERGLLSGVTQEGKSEYVSPETQAGEDSEAKADSKITSNDPTVTDNDQKPSETIHKPRTNRRIGGKKALEKAARILGTPEILTQDNAFSDARLKDQSATIQEEKKEDINQSLPRTSSWMQNLLPRSRTSSAVSTESDASSIASSAARLLRNQRHASASKVPTNTDFDSHTQPRSSSASRISSPSVAKSRRKQIMDSIDFEFSKLPGVKDLSPEEYLEKQKMYRELTLMTHEYRVIMEEIDKRGARENAAYLERLERWDPEAARALSGASERESSSFLGGLTRRFSRTSMSSQGEGVAEGLSRSRQVSWVDSIRPDSAVSRSSER